MNIIIIATGKCRDKSTLAIEAEFLKRLKPFLKTQTIEISQVKAQTVTEIKTKEAKLQLAKIPDNSHIIALDELGEVQTTLQFSKHLEKQKISGVKTVCFIIGGAEGLDDSIRKKAHKIISLSKLTFPHMLVRPILTEQIYRAATVIAGHPYHREG